MMAILQQSEFQKKSVLEGYRCKQTGLWRISLKAKVENKNTDTLLIDRPNPKDAIGHVFELPSIEKTVLYYHAAAGFPVKETWIKAIIAGNYARWPALSIKAVNKHYHGSNERQSKMMSL